MASASKRKLGWRLRATVILLAISGFSSLLGLYFWYKNRPPTLQEAFPSGTMLVGVDASFPPFAVDNGEGMYGLDIDLGNMIAADSGIPIRFVGMGYDGLYDSLIVGQVDVVISALLVNPARMRDVRYTRHYFDNGLMLVTSSSDIQTMEDLPSHALALEYGSIAHSYANLWLQRLSPFELRPYELPIYSLDSLRLGEADAALVDTTSYWLYLAEHPEWEADSFRVSNAYYAIAIRYDREDTWRWVNTILRQIIRDGRMDAMIQEWFN
jgi:polar amino acid transport system substrate-binding protein